MDLVLLSLPMLFMKPALLGLEHLLILWTCQNSKFLIVHMAPKEQMDAMEHTLMSTNNGLLTMEALSTLRLTTLIQAKSPQVLATTASQSTRLEPR